ncbi:VanZ family protein [Microbacterium trichothecenolyticum]|uniref:Glycopeptide antibiotics resistance protein n=1 Tax=Microbacterium trichothecenolyticum TaxID=69370 RepID=A0ABU0TWD9_MICTR|nr:VanZ family protein [Microbacterium trichothecenolyticum]MDQ1123242.1 glycopeptide antibiotics resistance protein [Microbacterium trichothecenolyticum]
MRAFPVPSRSRVLAGAAAGVYLVVLGAVVLWPVHLEQYLGFVYETLYGVVPTAASVDIDFLLNIVFFVPFGVLLARVLPRRPWLLLAIAWVVPLLVEIAQGVFLPGRTSSAIDVFANTLGGIGGAVAVGARRRFLTRRSTRRHP